MPFIIRILIKAKRKDFVNWGFLTLAVFAKNNSLKRGLGVWGWNPTI